MLPKFTPLDGVQYTIRLVERRRQSVGQVFYGWDDIAEHGDIPKRSHAKNLLILEVDGVAMVYFARACHALAKLEKNVLYQCSRHYNENTKQHVWDCRPAA